MERVELGKLSLTELKNLCKEKGLYFDRTKEELIITLQDYYKSMQTISRPTKVVKTKTKAIKIEDTKSLIEMGKLVEKKLARRTYYANGNIYFDLLD